MATDMSVKVVSIDFRQANIKVGKGSFLSDILEQACAKFTLSPDKYILKHKARELDMSNTVAMAGLLHGAKLELVVKSKSPSVITVGLALPEAEARIYGSRRPVEKLPSDFTVWKVLRHFEAVTFKGKGINITGRGVPRTSDGGAGGSGQLYYERPVLQLGNRPLSSFEDFQKTLSRYGYNSGSVAIRLSFQTTDRTLADAMGDISQYFDEEAQSGKDIGTSKADAQDSEGAEVLKCVKTPTAAAQCSEEQLAKDAQLGGDVQTSEAAAGAPEANRRTITDSQKEDTGKGVNIDAPAAVPDAGAAPAVDPMETDMSQAADHLAPAAVYSAPTSSTPAAALTSEPDDFFTPDIWQLKQFQQRLKIAGQNKRLPSDRELEEKAAADEARLTSIKSITIKVRFYDNTSAAWNIDPSWTGSQLYTAVRQVMVHPEAPFRIVYDLRMSIRDDATALIRGYGLTTNTTTNLVLDDAVPAEIREQPFLKQSAADRAQEIVVPEAPQYEEPAEGSGAAASAPVEMTTREGGGGLKKGIPKWLKGLSKK